MTLTWDDEQARALLLRVIAASGLSRRAWAERVVIRDERTVRRWIAGDSPIPEAVIAFLRRAAPRREWAVRGTREGNRLNERTPYRQSRGRGWAGSVGTASACHSWQVTPPPHYSITT